MDKKASYILSEYSSFTDEELLKIGNVNGKPIPSFEEDLLINLCEEAQETFEKESNVLEIEGDFIIVGDIHGSLHDLLRILNIIYEKKVKALFLGDYIDRGQFSLECITLLFAIKVKYPDTIYLLRGNHEFDSICSLYGFKSEILNNRIDENQYCVYDTYSINQNYYKYTESLYEAFMHAFSYLPIGAIVNKTTFCIHGGLTPKIELIDDINKQVQRPINNFEESELFTDLVWSDPTSSACNSKNPRGCGYLFNREMVENFLEKNSIKRIIRAHQCVINGYKSEFDDKCITIFSVSSYAKLLGNCSSIIQLSNDADTLKVSSFQPLNQLQKSDALFYKVKQMNLDLNTNNHSCISLAYPIPRLNQTIFHSKPNMNNGQIKIRRRVSLRNTKSNIVTLTKPRIARYSYPYQKETVTIIKSNTFKTYCDESIMK
ncbi:hypothetical protein M9Y10_033036 [Tritrichomonas musculus]|uniref:Serine/threonine-protein phosphatase n=1 Tax=Tritrichomonas musculus TaxID=1915356 RepID=A0ABR2GWV1_9EUKA